MSYVLRPDVPGNSLVGHLSLVGQMQGVLPRTTAATDESMGAAFRTLLLQQMQAAPDAAFSMMNEAETGTRASMHTWGLLLAMAQDRKPLANPAYPVQRATPRSVPGGPGVGLRPSVMPSPRPHRAEGWAASPLSRVPTKPAQAAQPEPGPTLPTTQPVKAGVPPASPAEGFLGKLAGVAKATAESLGLSPHLLLAQAALETGWGRKAIKDAAGGESHNLFGIKAGKHWAGKTVEVKTTEYVDGVPRQKVESFRAYGSVAESFADYARLIKRRYGEAMANGATAEGFGRALQAKGYATDPNYARKIVRVARSVAYRLSGILKMA